MPIRVPRYICRFRKTILHTHVTLHTVYWLVGAFTIPTSNAVMGLYLSLAALTVLVSWIEES